MRYVTNIKKVDAWLLATIVVAAFFAVWLGWEDQKAKGATESDLIAVSPVGNDLDPKVKSPTGPISLVPAPVEAKIRVLAVNAFRDWKNCAACEVRLEDFFGPILRITTPGRFDLYVFQLKQPTGADFYYFFLYDPASHVVTERPPSIYAKWMQSDGGSPLEKPIISFYDLDGDGQKELVVQEDVHNGTVQRHHLPPLSNSSGSLT